MVMLAQKDEQFRQVLNGADLAIADGAGLRLADWRLKRLTGIDLMLKLCQLAAEKGWRVFLLGARDRVAEKAARQLRRRLGQQDSGFKILAASGPADIERASQAEQKRLIAKINRFRPDLLLVAFGHGKQEKWIVNNLPRLSVKVAMGVGGAFDYIVRPWKRAPRLMQKLGLEWLWRLILEPWRIKRQLALVRFGWLIFTGRDLSVRS
jgi:N-acetylglucosaminyldiphosphoundecaprenol N-acetyl-beta-D-mannosaminyltransferase